MGYAPPLYSIYISLNVNPNNFVQLKGALVEFFPLFYYAGAAIIKTGHLTGSRIRMLRVMLIVSD
jgi:hypothetical protein